MDSETKKELLTLALMMRKMRDEQLAKVKKAETPPEAKAETPPPEAEPEAK